MGKHLPKKVYYDSRSTTYAKELTVAWPQSTYEGVPVLPAVSMRRLMTHAAEIASLEKAL